MDSVQISNLKAKIKTAKENQKKTTVDLKAMNEDLENQLFLLKIRIAKLSSSTMDTDAFFLESESILDLIKGLRGE